ncbi:protein VASCULATURE COMPLEXITY AND CONNECTIVITY-like [Gastrolobium bilobum]|uniref:protein VASCULATURE COMPLEXITY AND CONNECTIVITY-like n=1 Tax=Gastrolobium bilobum TaxID=150636 RepID=UPI002AB10377|nr:protein VASCULATURE COMPLEXITY AND CONNECTIVITY-like [Gastrolobium bilobum]
MAKVAGIFMCLLIVIMDVGAGILGFEAEIAQNKVKHLRLWIFECREPSHQAFMLGLGAAVLLGLAHAVANLLGGCNCICSQQEFDKASPNRQMTVVCFILTWVVLAGGLSTLVIGTMSNNRSDGSCGFSHHHFLSIGGILCFLHGLFSVAYYVSATASID